MAQRYTDFVSEYHKDLGDFTPAAGQFQDTVLNTARRYQCVHYNYRTLHIGYFILPGIYASQP